jgi:hypothetical protein
MNKQTKGSKTPMDMDRLNDWLSLVANFGVVIGLAILIIEINQAIDLAEVGAYESRITEISDTNKAIALDESLADIYERISAEGLKALTPVERRRVHAWESGIVARMQGQHYQYRRGFLEEDTAEAFLGAAARRLELWNELGINIVDEEFRQSVESTPIPPVPSIQGFGLSIERPR